MKSTVLEIDLSKFYQNVEKIQKYVGNKVIMPIIKANAYGTYLNKRLDVLNHFQIVGVAEVQEAKELRKIGYEKEIFVLNQPSIEELEDIYQYHLTIGVSEESFLEKINLPITVHLEIETGMNRTGIQKKNWTSFFERIQNNKNIVVEGIYTHFSSADSDLEYTKRQFQIFQEAVLFAKEFFSFKYVHCSASNGILNFPEDLSNLVRPGIILYGYESYPGAALKIPIEAVTRLKTKITYIKEVDANKAISYNQRFVTRTSMKIATIPIGYADGLRRCLTNKGEVVIQNEKRKILGTICMDSCMIDVTGMNVEVGDEVYLWDNEIITLDELANSAGSISYEIISTISDRVERVFVNENK